MNIANKLTLSRIFLIPIFIIILEIGIRDLFGINIELARFLAATIFIIAAFTDFLDGYIARKYNFITDFGKFMDPLADKIIVGVALIYLLYLGDISAWLVSLIFSREFIISGIRMIAANKNIVISAGILGKLKTISQMILIIFLLPQFKGNIFFIISNILIIISAFFTVISMIDYIWANKNIFKE